MNLKCRFFDPHPGLLGSLSPLPELIRKAVAQLDDQVLGLEDATSMIKKAADICKCSVSVGKSPCILVNRKNIDGTEDGWRVIKFEILDVPEGWVPSD